MITGSDQSCGITGEQHQAVPGSAGALPTITPEMARAAAAVLAPHVAAMRAVTAGTRFAVHGEDDRGDVTLSSSPPRPSQLSPATRIFIAGMLERLPAADTGGAASSLVTSF